MSVVKAKTRDVPRSRQHDLTTPAHSPHNLQTHSDLHTICVPPRRGDLPPRSGKHAPCCCISLHERMCCKLVGWLVSSKWHAPALASSIASKGWLHVHVLEHFARPQLALPALNRVLKLAFSTCRLRLLTASAHRTTRGFSLETSCARPHCAQPLPRSLARARKVPCFGLLRSCHQHCACACGASRPVVDSGLGCAPC